MRTESCPFCGQSLKERELVDAYKEFFSTAYRSLAKHVKQARESLARYKQGEFREKRDGPQFLDSSLSEISARHYAAFFAMGLAPYTASGVCRFNAW